MNAAGRAAFALCRRSPLCWRAFGTGESVQVLRARLLYQSKKRGIVECDLLLGGFASEHLQSLNETQLRDYDKFINGGHNEWDIYYWLSGAKPVPTEYDSEAFRLLRDYANQPNKFRLASTSKPQ